MSLWPSSLRSRSAIVPPPATPPPRHSVDLVEPRRRCRGEVHVEAWMPLKSSLHLGVLVCGIVVGDQVQVQPLRGIAVDGAQEFKPFLVAMALWRRRRGAAPLASADGDPMIGWQARDAIQPAKGATRPSRHDTLLAVAALACLLARRDIIRRKDRRQKWGERR